jgi:hypothetical protein
MQTQTQTQTQTRGPGVLPFALFLLGLAVVLTCAFVVNVPSGEVGVLLAVVALLAAALLVVGVRTGWRARPLALSALSLLALTALGGYLISMTTQTNDTLLALREQRAESEAAGYAQDAGFTALGSAGHPLDVNHWPVTDLADPPGLLLVYGTTQNPDGISDTGFTLAQYTATAPVTIEALRAMIGPGRPLYPTSSTTIPADAGYREFTVRGSPAVGAQWTQPTSGGPDAPLTSAVLITAADGVVLHVAADADLDYLTSVTEGLTPLS